MCAVAINPAGVFANAKDEAKIKIIIESVGGLADEGNFEVLEKLYAPEVEMDYSSLTGGEVEIKSPKTIMTEWASVLPGFDQTRHDVSNINVSSNGHTATATADVSASHWVNDLYWQVSGDYVFNLKKEEGEWQIVSHQFNLRDEVGTRNVFEAAIENATKNPVSYILRQKTHEAVINFLTSLEEKDMDKFADVWADDAVQHMPYAPDGFPSQVIGKENLIKHYGGWPENSGKADFTSELVFYPMQNPEMVFAEFRGDVDIIPTDRKYDQHYGGLFHVENGKIKLFREYFGPEPFKYAFGLDEGGEFSK